jgi:hypothetical protein
VSDEQTPRERVTLILRWTDYASKNLNARIAELKRRDQPIKTDAITEHIQFLRGVGSRASQLLPALHMLARASTKPKPGSEMPPWKGTQVATLNLLALRSVSLACRSILDEGPKRRLTGK